jgi:hypothetical protein
MGFMWCNYTFMNVCGFFVHQWDIRLSDLFKVLYVRLRFDMAYHLGSLPF